MCILVWVPLFFAGDLPLLLYNVKHLHAATPKCMPHFVHQLPHPVETTPPPLDHLAPHDHFLPLFAFAFMCGANSSCHASGLRLPTPDCPAKQMQIAAKIFRTFTKLSWIPGHQSNPPTCQTQSPNCDSYLSFSANECSNLAWKSAPNLQAPPPPHPIGNQRRWKALFR